MRSIRILAHIAIIAAFFFAPNSSRSETISAQDAMRLGEGASERGAIEEAVTFWQEATKLFARRKDARGEVEALLALGNAYQALGDQPAAIQVLEQAAALAEKSNDRKGLALAKNSLGTAWSCSRQTDWAERNLREALAITRELGDGPTTTSVLNNLGNLQTEQGNVADALATFQEAISLAQLNTNRLLTAKAASNAAAAAMRADRFTDARQFNSIAGSRKLPACPLPMRASSSCGFQLRPDGLADGPTTSARTCVATAGAREKIPMGELWTSPSTWVIRGRRRTHSVISARLTSQITNTRRPSC